ncbi:unnamed protein product [Arabidopsis lyrata]|nr:unnamed protein product [Arabidopsis lyrata]
MSSNQMESGDPYLPSDKQFLITRNVPCLRRAASVAEEYEAAGGEVLVDDEDNDGWLATHGKPKDKGNEDENLPSMDVLDINERNAIQSIPTYFGGEEDDDIPDMEEFDEADNVVENDPCYALQRFNILVVLLIHPDGIAFYISDNKVILTEGIDGVVPVDYFQKIESWPDRKPIPF